MPPTLGQGIGTLAGTTPAARSSFPTPRSHPRTLPRAANRTVQPLRSNTYTAPRRWRQESKFQQDRNGSFAGTPTPFLPRRLPCFSLRSRDPTHVTTPHRHQSLPSQRHVGASTLQTVAAKGLRSRSPPHSAKIQSQAKNHRIGEVQRNHGSASVKRRSRVKQNPE
jgi:hypothetical protein